MTATGSREHLCGVIKGWARQGGVGYDTLADAILASEWLRRHDEAITRQAVAADRRTTSVDRVVIHRADSTGSSRRDRFRVTEIEVWAGYDGYLREDIEADRARAWDEGVVAGMAREDGDTPDNPYRAEPGTDECVCTCGKPYPCDTDPHEWKPRSDERPTT